MKKKVLKGFIESLAHMVSSMFRRMYQQQNEMERKGQQNCVAKSFMCKNIKGRAEVIQIQDSPTHHYIL